MWIYKKGEKMQTFQNDIYVRTPRYEVRVQRVSKRLYQIFIEYLLLGERTAKYEIM